MTIVARQRISGLLEPVLVGVVCFAIGTAVPWLIGLLSWGTVLLGAWFCLGGRMLVWAGIRDWHPEGIGLVLDPEGLRYYCCGKPTIFLWEHIAGVRLVRWTSEGVEEQGLLLGVLEEGFTPLQSSEIAWHRKDLERQFGPLPWPGAVLLHDEHWDWNPQEVTNQIERSLPNPNLRDQW
ncbi:MAG: hypothetical protein WD847_06380 [Pirellulales bacterium]